jgi:predicted amidohydrolase
MQSGDHDIDGNLKRATAFADEAAAKGAQFVLFPELMPTGSYLFYDTWDAGEPSDGKTVRWLKSTSRRLHIWLGTSFLEAAGARGRSNPMWPTRPASRRRSRFREAGQTLGNEHRLRAIRCLDDGIGRYCGVGFQLRITEIGGALGPIRAEFMTND